MKLPVWSELDDRAIAISRALAMDAVQKVGNGHPGTTPGHPEYGHTLGVETTTGPLGQGVANGVGMAMAARYEKGLLDPNNITDIFDHNIWVLCSDGDLQEGVSAEASSLAGTQALGNLKVIYDDNRISIEGDTHVAFTEDVSARYKSYGWEVIEVKAQKNGDVQREELEDALIKAANVKDKPVLIRLQTVIAWPAPNAKGTAKSHGSALGAEEVAATKKILNLDPEQSFIAPDDVIEHARKVKLRGTQSYEQWQESFRKWSNDNPERADLLDRLLKKKLPQGWSDEFPVFASDKEISTRAASGKVIQSIAKSLPEFWGGSADLAESNNTTIEGSGSFLPTSSQMPSANPFGRVIHFGIREHAMGAILNGAALHGLVKPFAGTFLVFSDYMRGAVRLSALMKLPVTFVWTHDSIGLGEDGPTHQPVEHLAALRAMPGLDVVALAAREILAAKSIKARVVSVPCFEWFLEQPISYQEEVLPKNIKARVSIEAGVAQPWYRFIGDYGVAVSLEHFGASASASTLFQEFGFTPEKIASSALESLRKSNG